MCGRRGWNRFVSSAYLAHYEIGGFPMATNRDPRSLLWGIVLVVAGVAFLLSFFLL